MKTCQNCEYYEVRNSTTGTCRIRSAATYFPVRNANDWCAEFKPKDVERTE